MARQADRKDELRPLVDEEIDRLPAKYRDPLILCLLQGKARREAARLLGWTEGTLSGRLARGKEMLGKRLRRRGVEPSAAVATIPIHVPAVLTAATVKAALSLPGPVEGSLGVTIIPFMEEVLKSMVTMKLKTVVGVLVLLVGLGIGTGLTARQRGPAAQGAAPIEAEGVARERASSESKKENISEYVIEPPDVLHVQYGRPEGAEPVRISGPMLVRPDGTIGLGPLGSALVLGRTVREARAAIAKHLASRLDAFDAEKLTVNVKEYNSKFVYLILQDGEHVVRLPVSRQMTVLDALAKAHEILPTLIGLGKKQVHVARKADGEQSAEVLPVDVLAIIRDGNTATNHRLRAGDRIYIDAVAARRGIVLQMEDAEARRLPRPTMEEVARALPKTWANAMLKKITFAVVSHQLEEPRMYPLVGRARLARTHWKCTVFGDKGVERVYFDRDELIPCR
jgi:protein involved in polysaccharide export with SLBB domain